MTKRAHIPPPPATQGLTRKYGERPLKEPPDSHHGKWPYPKIPSLGNNPRSESYANKLREPLSFTQVPIDEETIEDDIFNDPYDVQILRDDKWANVVFLEEFEAYMYKLWKHAIVINPKGRNIGYQTLKTKLEKLCPTILGT